MDEEQVFWIRLWAIVGVVISIFIISLTVSAAHTTYRVAEAIKNGVDPMQAKCALDMPAEDGKLVCVIVREK